MARIKVIDTLTGKKGSIDEKDFDPTRFKPDYNFIQKLVTSETIPSIAALLTGTAAGVPGILAGGPLGLALGVGAGGIGAGVAKQTQSALRPFVGLPEETPKQKLKGQAEAFAKGAVQEAGGRAIGWAGGKILGPILGKIKIGTPATMKASSEAVKNTVGRDLDNLLTSSADKKISLKTILSQLDDLKAGYKEAGVDDAVKAVESLEKGISSKGTSVSPSIAQTYKEWFGGGIFRPTGREVAPIAPSSKLLKSTKKIIGGGFGTEIKETVPGAADLYSQYGAASNIAKQLETPFQGYWKGFIPGALLAPTNPSLAASITPPAVLASMPYTRLLTKKLMGTALTNPFTQAGSRLGIYELLNLLGGNSAEGEYLPQQTSKYGTNSY